MVAALHELNFNGIPPLDGRRADAIDELDRYRIGGRAIRVVLAIVTPVIAEYMLRFAAPNRPLRKSRVLQYAHRLSAGQWRLNGETIVFSSDGLLIEGQHRLSAVVTSGVPMETLVVFGIAPEAFASLNQGAKRGVGDILHIAGETNTALLAAAGSTLHAYEAGRLGWQSAGYGGGFQQPSPDDILAIIERNPGLRDAIGKLGPIVRSIMPPALAVTLLYLFSQSDPEMASLFIQSLEDGVNLRIDDPIRQLRERLFRNKASKSRLPRAHIAALTIKAWNMTKEGRSTSLLKWGDDESFPVVL